MTEADLEIINKLGLHARAASRLANLCMRFSSKTTISRNNQTADGKGLMSLMLLAAAKGSTVHVHCEGNDEHEAIEAIRTLIANRFDESE
jgi:phosphocarrier protein